VDGGAGDDTFPAGSRRGTGPLRFREYLGAKIATLTGLSLLSAVPIALAARLNLFLAVLGVALLAVLFLLLCFALVVRQPSITAFLTVAPLSLAPLIAAPLAHLTGVVDHPILYVVPTTAAAEIIRSGLNPAALGYALLAIAGATWLARRRFTHEPADTTRPRPTQERHHPWRPRGWLAALVNIDRRTTLRSALLTIVLTGPILLAVALRLGYPPLAGYLRDRFGVDLTPYQPVLLASLVVLHVPLITAWSAPC
jgi:fluoroquinolone transport system permease protein